MEFSGLKNVRVNGWLLLVPLKKEKIGERFFIVSDVANRQNFSMSVNLVIRIKGN